MALLRPAVFLRGRNWRVNAQWQHTMLFARSVKTLQKFKLADIGEGITECEVIKWNVKLSARVEAFDQLCEVQSDKASVEITSPFDGIVKEILVQEGEVAKVGQGLCLIEVEDDSTGDVNATLAEPVGSSEAASPPPHPQQESTSTTKETELSAAASSPEAKPAKESATSSRRPHPLDDNRPAADRAASTDEVFAAPSVRHFARQSGVDLAKVAPGSGKDGRVEKADVEAYLARRTAASAPAAAKEQPTTAPSAGAMQDTVVELGRTRHSMWKAMEKSLEIPHFGYTTSLDITHLHSLLPLLNANIPVHFLPPPSTPPKPLAVSPSAIFPSPEPERVPSSQQFTRLTYLPFLLKTLSKAMHIWPLLRSSITPGTPSGSKPTLTVRPHADINIALSTTSGLYTPTLQNVNSESVYGLASRLAHLAHLGRQSPPALGPKEMPRRGGTLSVSNVGALGAGEVASPVLVPGGGVAIVALGRARWVWDVERSEKGERRLKLPVSWSADHRVVEGAELAAFVECWRAFVEAPERLIAEGI